MDYPIYLDYMATTPVDPKVKQEMMRYLDMDGKFGNPSSDSHIYGWEAQEAVKCAREQVAHLINAEAREIIWTSGATEANNLAIKGAAHFHKKNGRHIITMTTEHKAVLDTCRALSEQGFDLTYLNPKPNGLLDLDQLTKAIRKDTILVSIMQVNNEIGVIQDLAKIAEIVKARGALLHSDAAQSAGKLAIDVKTLPIDLMSFSSHKLYGPKGVGALYVRRQPRVHITPQVHGGGHEFGLRSGTLPTHQVVGMGQAFSIAREQLDTDIPRIHKLTAKLWQGISQLEDVHLHGDANQRVAGNLNVSFSGVDGEALIFGLRNLALSSNSACNSASLQPSYVLKAIGVPTPLAHVALRICIGRFTTDAEVEQAITSINQTVKQLRSMAPLTYKA